MPRRRPLVRFIALTLGLLSATFAAGQTRVGAEFQVNTYTVGGQDYAAAAMNEEGSFMVVWRTSPSGSHMIAGQRYDSAGDPVGSEVLVSNPTFGNHFPNVTLDPAGNAVVAWEYNGDVLARRFDSSGAPLGAPFFANTHTASHQFRPDVASDDAGNFVVSWMSYLQDGDQWGIFGQRFSSSGAFVGDEFQVNAYTTDRQWYPAVAMGGDGEFVITWESQAGTDDVFGRRFDSSGAPVGGEFQVNSYTTSKQTRPKVAISSTGAVLVAWLGPNPGAEGQGVFGQPYDSVGSPVGGEFAIPDSGGGYDQRMTMDADEGFVVAWQNSTLDGSGYGIFGRRLDAAGAPQGEQFLVNAYTPGSQSKPGVGMGADGDFVVAWQDQRDGSNYGISAQRFDGAPPLISLLLNHSFEDALDPDLDWKVKSTNLGGPSDRVCDDGTAVAPDGACLFKFVRPAPGENRPELLQQKLDIAGSRGDGYSLKLDYLLVNVAPSADIAANIIFFDDSTGAKRTVRCSIPLRGTWPWSELSCAGLKAPLDHDRMKVAIRYWTPRGRMYVDNVRLLSTD